MSLIIFDFDGVIVDSEKEKFKIVQQVAQENNVVISDNLYPQFIGKKRGFFLQQLTDENTVQDIMCKVHKKDEELTFALMSHIDVVLQFLRTKQCTIALATGSKSAVVTAVLKKYKLTDYFDFIVTGDEVNESKPDPAVFLYMMHQFPQETHVYIVEDSPAGIEAGKKTKATVIGLGNKDADVYVVDHNALVEYFKRIL